MEYTEYCHFFNCEILKIVELRFIQTVFIPTFYAHSFIISAISFIFSAINIHYEDK